MIIDGPGCFKDLLIKGYNLLLSPKANILWDKLIKVGLMDENRQPADNVSDTKCALIAKVMALKLNIPDYPKLFKQLWGIDSLTTLLCHARYCKYYWDLTDFLFDLFEMDKSVLKRH